MLVGPAGLPIYIDQPMASHPRETRPRVDGDGVRTIETSPVRRAVWLAALAIGLPILATIVAIVVIRWAPAERSDGPTRPPARDIAGSAVDDTRAARAPDMPLLPAPAKQVKPRRVAAAKPPPTNAEDAKPELEAKDVIPALIEAGERGGIAVFPLPGTEPIKRGLLVPEDFELPEGYVRHYQATDDGQRLPAILMFHPDYEFVDERGEPVPLPENRVVPPEMAPPGLPIQMLVVPEKQGAPDPAP